MHIPDGYLSPTTCAALYGAAVPAWMVASRKVRKVVKNRNVPLIAVAAAYCFLVMMFNVPVPDGTTAHAVGGVLVAVVLGPWAAVIAVSVALAIQALFFGDGGLLAYGANAFNLAVVMPMAGYAVYRLLSRNAALTARRRAIAAGVGSYVGINAAALLTAIEFGVQPTLFHTANGTPLYAPFHLTETIPAMALAHLTVAGAVELALTMGVVTYLQRANVPLLRLNHARVADRADVTDAAKGADGADAPARTRWRPLVVGLAVMTVLTPLGLLASGAAYGEETAETRYLDHSALTYVLSAVIGLALIAAVVGTIVVVVRAVQRRRAVATAA